MKSEEIIHSILTHEVFVEKPPVLLDIGASGKIHPEWSQIAPYSVCLAFDADSRDFNEQINDSGYKKLILINAIVSDLEKDKTSFYLTASPHCSSSLEPLNNQLEDWSFSELFRVEKIVELKNISIAKALNDHGLFYIDWFKTDSQGIDLRLFRHLPEAVQKNVIVAEFEPGFIHAYDGEDNIPAMLNYMDQMPFWLSDFSVKGSQRINKQTREKYLLDPGQLQLKNSACWAEMVYINKAVQFSSTRDLMLALVFSIIKKQFGFALELADRLETKMDQSLQQGVVNYILAALRKSSAPEQASLFDRIKKLVRS